MGCGFFSKALTSWMGWRSGFVWQLISSFGKAEFLEHVEFNAMEKLANSSGFRKEPA